MTDWTFLGFEARDGRAVARFRSDAGDLRAIPVDACLWPAREDEEPHAEPEVQARLVRATRQLVALTRTAHVLAAPDAARAPRRRRRAA